MKVSINDKEIFTISEFQKKVIQNEIPSDIFEEDIKRRIKWAIFDQKYANCLKKLRNEWEQRLKEEGVQSFPTSDEEFASMVFSHPHYKDRTQREMEAKNFGSH